MDLGNKQEAGDIDISSTSGIEMAGRGTKLWHYLVLTGLVSTSFATEIPRKEGLFCTEIPAGEEREVEFPLYVGLYPVSEKWKWDSEFRDENGDSFYRLSLHCDGQKIEIQSDKANKAAEWAHDFFPLNEWSYLAIYFDGSDLMIIQKQDMEAGIMTSRLQRRRIIKTTMNASGVEVTYSCIKGHSITHSKDSLQVESDCLYFLQSTHQSMTVSSGSTSLEVTNVEWHDIVNQSEKYSFEGVIFVVRTCDSALVGKWRTRAVLSGEGIPSEFPKATSVPPKILKERSLQWEQPESPTPTDGTPTVTTTEPPSLRKRSRTDVKTTTKAASAPRRPKKAASGGTVAATAIALLLLVLVAGVVCYREGYVAEASRFCCETVCRRREVTPDL